MLQDVHQKIIIYYNYEGSLRKILICFYYEKRNHIKKLSKNSAFRNLLKGKSLAFLIVSKAFHLCSIFKMIFS